MRKPTPPGGVAGRQTDGTVGQERACTAVGPGVLLGLLRGLLGGRACAGRRPAWRGSPRGAPVRDATGRGHRGAVRTGTERSEPVPAAGLAAAGAGPARHRHRCQRRLAEWDSAGSGAARAGRTTWMSVGQVNGRPPQTLRPVSGWQRSTVALHLQTISVPRRTDESTSLTAPRSRRRRLADARGPASSGRSAPSAGPRTSTSRRGPRRIDAGPVRPAACVAPVTARARQPGNRSRCRPARRRGRRAGGDVAAASGGHRSVDPAAGVRRPRRSSGASAATCADSAPSGARPQEDAGGLLRRTGPGSPAGAAEVPVGVARGPIVHSAPAWPAPRAPTRPVRRTPARRGLPGRAVRPGWLGCARGHHRGRRRTRDPRLARQPHRRGRGRPRRRHDRPRRGAQRRLHRRASRRSSCATATSATAARA